MRNRPWVLVVAIIGFLLIFGSYSGWRLTKANERIRILILSQIRPYLDPQSDIKKLELTLGDLRLKDVVLIPKNRRYTLQIDDIRIRYQLWNMVRYGFSPRKIAHEALFVHPVLFIHQPHDSLPESSDTVKTIHSDELVETLRLIKRITLRKGSLYYENILGDTVQVAHDLNGLLLGARPDSSQIRLDGKLFSSEKNNLNFNGHLDLTVPGVKSATIQVLESEPTQEQPLLLPKYVSITSGKIEGKVEYHDESGISGSIQVNDAGFTLRGVDIACRGMDLQGDILDNRLSIQSHIKSFNGSPLEVSGILENFLNPDLDINVHCSQFHVTEFFEQAIPGINLEIEGKTQFDVNISGSPYNPRMNGGLTAKDLNVFGIRFGSLDTRISLVDSVFSLQGTGSRTNELNMTINSRLDVRQHRQYIDLASHVTGNFHASLPEILKSRITRSTGVMNFALTGNLGALSGEINGSFNLATLEGDSILIQPELLYKDRILSVNIGSNMNFRIAGEVQSPFYAEHQWELEGEGLSDLFKPIFSDRLRGYLEDINLTGHYQSNKEAWTFNLDGLHRDASRPITFSFDMNSKKSTQNASPIFVDVLYKNADIGTLPVHAEWLFDKSGIDVRQFHLGNFARLNGYIPFSRQDSFNVDLRIPDGIFEALHPVFPGLLSFHSRINGHLSLRGTPDKPDIQIHSHFMEGFFHDIGPFRSDFDFVWAEDSLHYMQWNIWENDSLLIHSVVHESKNDSLSGLLTGHKMDVRKIVTAITGIDPDVEAIGDLRIQIQGLKTSPVLVQEMKIPEGTWGVLPFRNFSLTAIDTLWKKGAWTAGKEYIQMVRLEHPNGFTLAGWGDLPHNSNETMDLSLLGQGNLLGLLKDLGSAVKSGQGDTEFFLRFGGRRGEWTIGEGRFDIQNGELQLESVVKEIQHIQGSGILFPEDQFIQLNNFRCVIDKGPVEISNRLIQSDENEIPLEIGLLNMQLGILQIKSRQKGVLVHVPGIMEKGDKGRLWFTGKNDLPYFTISGPVDAPDFTGAINLSDAQITYPFLATRSSGGRDPVMGFLGNINWDIQIVPDRDVHYVREIGSALGNVYVNLWLRDDFGNISVAGQNADATIEAWGELLSTEGNLEILDHYFRVERVDFQYARGSSGPVLTGRASTTVVDSTGMSSTIWANLVSSESIDDTESSNGSLSRINIQFTTDNPALGITEADLLAALGYSVEGMRDRAYDALGMQMENMLIRPILKPIEKGIRRHLGLDLVRFSSMFSRNFVQLQTEPAPVFDPKLLLRSAKLMLGKYIAPGLFVTYSGQVGSQVWYYYHTQRLGLRHAITLEYTIVPDLFLEFEYMYDSQLLDDRREDKRILIKHTFPF